MNTENFPENLLRAEKILLKIELALALEKPGDRIKWEDMPGIIRELAKENKPATAMWIKHDGGLCPVGPQDKVLVRLKGGFLFDKADLAKNYLWTNVGDSCDIDEYYVVR